MKAVLQGMGRSGRKQVTAGSCKRNSSLASQLPLQNRYEALSMVDKGNDETEEEESVQVLSPSSDQPTLHIKSCIKTSSEKKRQQVIVIGDSLMGGTEAPICRPNSLFREVCCLPGA